MQTSLISGQLARLKKEVEACPTTVNETILRALFLTLHDFRKAYGYYRVGERMRLIVPISIRDFSDRRLLGYCVFGVSRSWR